MANKRIIETVGTITKKENLVAFECEKNHILIMESVKPYPGYNGTTVPEDLHPGGMFLVTRENYSGEAVIRATMAVKKKTDISFDAAPARISLFNTMNPCIRILDLQSCNQVDKLITLYRECGIDFKKYKKIDPFDGLIVVRKYFRLEEVEDAIYCDLDEPSMAYFELPGFITWEKFEKITLGIKPNVEYNNFDAAMGVFFTPKGVIDVVRIYHNEINIKEIKIIRAKYLEEISRLS